MYPWIGYYCIWQIKNTFFVQYFGLVSYTAKLLVLLYMEALAVTMGLKTVIMYKRCISVCPIISSYFLVNHITGNLGSVYTILAHIIPSK